MFDLDARLGRSTVSTCGIGEGRDPGEMKASVHVVTTVCHGSVYLQSFVVVMGREHRGRNSKDCLDLGMRGTILSGIYLN